MEALSAREVMNTPAQPLDHRTFLQQYVLAGPFETPISPEQLVSEANEVWNGIEAAVREAERAAGVPEPRSVEALIAEAGKVPGAVLFVERLPPLSLGHTQYRPVDAFSRGELRWKSVRANLVTSGEYIFWTEKP